MAKFPDLSFHQLTEGNGELAESLDEIQSLHAFRAGKVMVIDFWHTKCTRCPAALEKLNNMAESYADEAEAVMFVGCALSQGDGNKDIVVDMVDGEWENLTHIFISIEQKEIAKKALGFTAVPFVAVIGKSGNIVAAGEPKSLDIQNLIASAKTSTDDDLKAPTASETNENSAAQPTAANYEFTLDEDF